MRPGSVEAAGRVCEQGIDLAGLRGEISPHHRLAAAWALGAAGYAGGLLLSTAADLPSGPMIVWVLVSVAVVVEILMRIRNPASVRLATVKEHRAHQKL